jgi:hypothetical protein
MESKISCSLVFFTTTKLVWEQAQKLYSGVNNYRRIYDLHRDYFSLALNDNSLEDYYFFFLINNKFY